MSIAMNPLLGGVLIGISSSLMLLGLGRITGISGMLSTLLAFKKEDTWKYSFFLGLISGAAILYGLYPDTYFNFNFPSNTSKTILGGLLVGFGTRLGNGCTSGHGVCGVARMARRSIVATVTFIATGMVVVGIEGVLK